MKSEPDQQRPLGEFYGKLVQSRPWNGLALSETTYAPNFVIPWHSHAHSLICLVLSGELTERHGKGQRHCPQSTVTFYPENEAHGETVHGAGARLFSIGMPSCWMKRLDQSGGGLRQPLASRSNQAVSLGQRLYREFRFPDEFSPLAVEGLALELLAELMRSAKEETGRPRWLEAARDLLHARYRERLTLTDVAQSVGVHPAHLATTFRQHFACTLGTYQRRLRVEYAREQLLDDRLSLCAIALDAGFADQAHFSRTFRQVTGLTPAEYRKLRPES